MQHLGNLLGAIRPAMELSAAQPNEPGFFFIADLHALTSVKDPNAIRANTLHTAATWLACGLDTEKDVFYRQSRIPEVTELAWYLNCYTPYPMLANAHSFKDKQDNLADVNAGLFTYPVLMAADILLYDAEEVPVGKDQIQHLEITRDIANSFNVRMEEEVFVLPTPKLRESVKVVPGTDGRKMSKSYGNVINLFVPDKTIRKQVMKIMSDSTPLEAPKDPDKDLTFQLYRVIASPDEVATLRGQYLAGGFGYGHAKQLLYERLLDEFAAERQRYNALMENPSEIEARLKVGEARAREVALGVLDRVRHAVGYRG